LARDSKVFRPEVLSSFGGLSQIFTKTTFRWPPTFALDQTLRAALQDLPRKIDGQFAFYDAKTDKPYKDVKRSFTTACRKAGINDFHFHDMRHTFASHLVMAGADVTTVKELLGHKTLAMTLRYSHLAPKHKANAVALLDKRLRSGLTSTEPKREVI
jgi:integrase